MHRQFACSLIRVHIFLFFICVVVNASLHGMDAMHEIVMREIVTCNVDHGRQRMFAVLNTTYNKIIEDNYRPDKKRIECLMKEKDIPIIYNRTSWKKDFSRCAWVNY